MPQFRFANNVTELADPKQEALHRFTSQVVRERGRVSEAMTAAFLDAGWGTWGFKATPVAGETMAATVATHRNHPLIESFDWGRFGRFELTGEKGAASVGH